MAEMLEPPFLEPDLLLRLLFWERIRLYGIGAGRIPVRSALLTQALDLGRLNKSPINRAGFVISHSVPFVYTCNSRVVLPASRRGCFHKD